MFTKQKPWVPKSRPKPEVIRRTVSVPRAPTPAAAASRTNTPTSSSVGPSQSSSSSSTARKRGADGRPRAHNSPFAASSTSADEARGAARQHLTVPLSSSSSSSSSSRQTNKKNKKMERIRSPATDEVRVVFDESDGDEDEAPLDELFSKRQRTNGRTDEDRQLRNAALTELADAGYTDKSGKALKFVHAREVVGLAHGDAKVFPEASDEDSAVELQYPGSLTRERFELVNKKDKLDVIKDIIRVVRNVRDTYITDKAVQDEFDDVIIRKLERNANAKILNISAFKDAIDKYNQTVLDHLKSGAIVAAIDGQHELPNNLVKHILNQVYDRVVTPKVDLLKKYDNGTDNVYGEMNKIFITKILCDDLRMFSKDVFVDLGSGVGNVVLQAALQIGCESWGFEMMDAPSTLAKAQYQEFKARCKLWGIQPGKVRLMHGDFRTHKEIGVLQRADVVLANNQAFTPDLNDRLKIMFLDLKQGCRIASLKTFATASKYNENDIANSILTEPEKKRWPAKGVSWTDATGDYYITRKK